MHISNISNMVAKIIVIMSPKGGVGKTTISVNLATALSELGKKTLLIDANLETPHVAVYYGFVGFKYSFEDLLEGKAKIEDVIYKGENENFHLLPARVLKDSNKVINKLVNINSYIKEVNERYDFIIIDSKPSYNIDFIKLINAANSLIISNLEITSIIEAKKLKEKLDEFNINVIGLILNKFNYHITEQITENEAADITNIKNVWKVREDNIVYRSLKYGVPVIISAPKSWISKDIVKIAKDLIKL